MSDGRQRRRVRGYKVGVGAFRAKTHVLVDLPVAVHVVLGQNAHHDEVAQTGHTGSSRQHLERF